MHALALVLGTSGKQEVMVPQRIFIEVFFWQIQFFLKAA